jgi:hypothetical protein
MSDAFMMKLAGKRPLQALGRRDSGHFRIAEAKHEP